MDLLAGTSGYSYKEWKGSFYPEKLAADGMLRYYAERFPTVEINNTFYRMPGEGMLARWAGEVPDHFAFTLKAPQRITHDKRLREAEGDVAEFLRRAARARTEARAAALPAPAVLQEGPRGSRRLSRAPPAGPPDCFRVPPPTWEDEAVYEMLRAHNAMLCAADTDKGDSPPLVATVKVGLPAAAPGRVQRRRAAGVGEADRRPALGAGLRLLQA